MFGSSLYSLFLSLIPHLSRSHRIPKRLRDFLAFSGWTLAICRSFWLRRARARLRILLSPPLRYLFLSTHPFSYRSSSLASLCLCRVPGSMCQFSSLSRLLFCGPHTVVTLLNHFLPFSISCIPSSYTTSSHAFLFSSIVLIINKPRRPIHSLFCFSHVIVQYFPFFLDSLLLDISLFFSFPWCHPLMISLALFLVCYLQPKDPPSCGTASLLTKRL